MVTHVGDKESEHNSKEATDATVCFDAEEEF
jgi:hypothetical protein